MKKKYNIYLRCIFTFHSHKNFLYLYSSYFLNEFLNEFYEICNIHIRTSHLKTINNLFIISTMI